jgi:hypothetical protein
MCRRGWQNTHLLEWRNTDGFGTLEEVGTLPITTYNESIKYGGEGKKEV